jgi:hypothetical protein
MFSLVQLHNVCFCTYELIHHYNFTCTTGMNNFGGGNFPQSSPQSLFGGMQPQQRGQTGMPGMAGSGHPAFGGSGLQTNPMQQQAHNQFMMNRQGISNKS